GISRSMPKTPCTCCRHSRCRFSRLRRQGERVRPKPPELGVQLFVDVPAARACAGTRATTAERSTNSDDGARLGSVMPPTARSRDQLLTPGARSLMVEFVVAYIWPTGAPKTSGVCLADATARGTAQLRGERTVQDSARRRDRIAAGQPRRSSPRMHVPGPGEPRRSGVGRL